jgi:formamidopyrimidine-DNA glycosylase
MPELPEVETIVQELSNKIKGKRIAQIKILNPKLRYPIPANISDFTYLISSVTRKAKFIVVTFDSNDKMIVHLGMTGKILITKNHVLHKHDHLVITLEDGTYVVYNDTRKFGFITTLELAPPSFFASAPDPFEHSFSEEILTRNLQTLKSPIKTCLMNNNLITGVGNIYASEALFKAKILPTRAANTLTTLEITLLIKEIKSTLSESIKAGGSSIKDYRTSSGSMGYFQQQLFVYNRTNKPCKMCNHLIERVVLAGRSSFFCSDCQK